MKRLMLALILGAYSFSIQAATLQITNDTLILASTSISCSGNDDCPAFDENQAQLGTVAASASSVAGTAEAMASLSWNWDGMALDVNGIANTTSQADTMELLPRADGTARSYFSADIILESPHFYEGSFDFGGTSGQSFDLLENDISIVSLSGCVGIPCNFSGRIAAGNQKIVAFINSSANSGGEFEEELGNFSVNVNFTPVPIPTAFWLFSSGLGLLAWMRKKSA